MQSILSKSKGHKQGNRFSNFLRVSTIGCLILGSTASLSGCNQSSTSAPASAPQIPTVAVVRPEKSQVQESMDYTGRIEPSQKVEVRSRVSGYIEAIKFRDGQLVKAGDPLFVIDPRPFVAIRDRAQASVAQAVARETLTSAQFERISRIHAAGATSTEDLDRSRGEFSVARAAALATQAELRSAELELSYTTIRAPISGWISDRKMDVGNYVAGGAAQGIALTNIVTLSPVHAIVDLSEADMQRLRQQKKFPEQVQLNIDGMLGTHSAKIDFIDKEANTRSGTVRMRASIGNADQTILPGYFVRMHIPVGSSQDRLLLPDAAIQSDQTKKLVLVVDAKGQTAVKRVDVGGLVGDKRVVLSGLAATDQVIVSGAQRVRPGDHVQLAKPVNGS